jgi:hypothetical protein
MNQIPDKIFLRRGEVIEGLGITEYEMTNLVRCKVLHEVHLTPKGRAHFLRSEVVAMVERVTGVTATGRKIQ